MQQNKIQNRFFLGSAHSAEMVSHAGFDRACRKLGAAFVWVLMLRGPSLCWKCTGVPVHAGGCPQPSIGWQKQRAQCTCLNTAGKWPGRVYALVPSPHVMVWIILLLYFRKLMKGIGRCRSRNVLGSLGQSHCGISRSLVQSASAAN